MSMTPHALVWFIQIHLNSYMKTEVNPQDTKRAEAFKLWMSSPMSMVNRYVGNNDIKYVFRIYRVSEELYTIRLKAAAETLLASQYTIAA